MRRDRWWAGWPLAVLLGTALALAPLTGALADAMEVDGAGDQPTAVATDDGDLADPVDPTTTETDDPADPTDPATADPADPAEGSDPVTTDDPADPKTAVSSAEELAAALEAGGRIVLADDVTLGEEALAVTTDTQLDLNGHVLTGILKVGAATLTLQDTAGGGLMVSPAEDFPLLKGDGATVVAEGGAFAVSPPAWLELAPGLELVEKDGTWVVAAIPAHVHELTAHEAIPATCTDPGTAAYWACAGCGELFADGAATTPVTLDELAVPDTGHALDAVPEVASTCTTPGTATHWVCTACGTLFADADATQTASAEELALPLAPHELTAIAEVPASCTTPGTAAHWTCTTCGTLFADEAATMPMTTDDLVTPTEPHKLEAVPEIAATCTTAGRVGHWRCTTCGTLFANARATETLSEGALEVPATGHALTYHEAVAATTEAPGNLAYWECTECGALFADEAATTETTLEAVTTPQLQVFTVTFDDCLVNTEDVKITVTEGGTVARPKDPTAKGYLFKGWYLFDGTWPDDPYDFAQPVTGDFTLYAKWEEDPNAKPDPKEEEKNVELVPETGDTTNSAAAIMLATLGVLVIAGTTLLHRRFAR